MLTYWVAHIVFATVVGATTTPSVSTAVYGVSTLTEDSFSVSGAGVAEQEAARKHAESFYKVQCHAHTYELSISSFASVWILVNCCTLLCAFVVFLKHWCFKIFTDEAVKGY